MAGTRRIKDKTATKTKKQQATKATKSKKKLTKAAVKSHTPQKLKKRDVKADSKKAEDKEEMKEIKASISNGIMIDHKIQNPANYEVVKIRGTILNANLMYADCVHNNNKFYIIQGLKSGSSYYLWTRWGRVGVDGQSSMILCASEDNLIRQYSKKINSKKSKGYNEIEISYEDVSKTTKKLEKLEKKNSKKKGKKPKKDCQLDKSVQDLLRFIFDMKMIEKSVVKVGFNVKKLPLGKLSKSTILKGYAVLKEIDKELKGTATHATLGKLSSDFYSIIPHDFGFAKLSNFIINSREKLKEKLELVETLGDIQIAAEIMNAVEEEDDDNHELDSKYNKMK